MKCSDLILYIYKVLFMFIRETKTGNKKTGEAYIKHQLVESYRTKKGPRQRVILNLGQIKIARKDWRRLAFELEKFEKLMSLMIYF